MSSFIAFSLVSELQLEGFAPCEVSLATTARACVELGAHSLAELVGINFAEAPEMVNMPENDRRKLQAHKLLLF
jgi:hypothetical protein